MRCTKFTSVALPLCIAAGAVVLMPASSLVAAGPQVPAGAVPSAQYRAVIDKYCVSCHSTRTKAGGLVLEGIDLSRPSQHAAILEKVAHKLVLREMPPAGAPRPEVAVYQDFASWLQKTLDGAAATAPNPGRPMLHRLNRTEYANAIRDLLGIEVDAEALLPPDDSTHGFDNIADVLGVSPDLLESYVNAGRKISQMALGSPAMSVIQQPYHSTPDTDQDSHQEGLPFGTRGGLRVEHLFTVDGEYDFKVRLVRAVLDQIKGLQEPHTLLLSIDGVQVRPFQIDGGPHMYQEAYYNGPTPALHADDGLRIRLPVKAGTRTVIVAFPVRSSALTEEQLKPSGNLGNSIRGLPQVEGVTITGPYSAKRPESAAARLMTCRPPTAAEELPCARRIVSTFARRAYRGQATDADVQVLLDFYTQGRQEGDFYTGIEMAVWRALTSPKFIFRVETDPKGVAPGSPYRISDVELASRLSFFLWSTVPDDRLLDAASRGTLRQPALLEREVKRMLADDRANAMVRNFARQWLSLQKLPGLKPDGGRFPGFDDNLRQSAGRETELLFENVMRQNRSVLELLTADYTFVDERLARHYGMPNIYGSRFRRVPVPDQRRGLLGHASILTVTSFPTRTSPVVRGKWILETLIGSPPPPPPADVPALQDGEKDSGGKPLGIREQMAKHRANPVCASCHSRMDPLGFALEPFDAIGGARKETIDATGALPDGTKFDGPAGLREALVQRPEIFVHTLTEKLFIYALGRGLEYYDAPAIRTVTHDAQRADNTFSSIVLGIVKSVPFQMRRALEARATPAATTAARQ